MKPKTKSEKEVAMLSKKLGNIGKRDMKKLIRGAFAGDLGKSRIDNRRYSVLNISYMGWQVMRYVLITKFGKIGDANFKTWEIMQVWTKMGIGQVIMARKRAMSFYLDAFCCNSELEIRRPNLSSYASYADVEPYFTMAKSVDDLFLCVDQVADDRDCHISKRLAYQLVAGSNYPTHFIKKNTALVVAIMRRMDKKERAAILPALKIIARHKYYVYDPMSYIDYLRALVFLGKDIHNPFYVCPADFRAMHDKYVAQMAKKQEKKRKEDEVNRKIDENKAYEASHGRFFGIQISNGHIQCHVLQSVMEFYEEGTAMHHCVYACGYYKKPNSVVFSARIDGKRIETVEFSLRERRVVQAYGNCDTFTEYHNEIVELVNDNADLIESYNKPLSTAV